jgi:hypothetical protein
MTNYFVATDIFGWRTRGAYVAAACLAADMDVQRRKILVRELWQWNYVIACISWQKLR